MPERPALLVFLDGLRGSKSVTSNGALADRDAGYIVCCSVTGSIAELILSSRDAGITCLRQVRIMSKSSGRENLVSLASGSPASAFIGRNTVASFTPGRMRRKTPCWCLGPGIGGVTAIRNSPFGLMCGTA